MNSAVHFVVFNNGAFVFCIIGKQFSLVLQLESTKLTNMQRAVMSKHSGEKKKRKEFFLILWRKIGKGMMLTDLLVRQPNQNSTGPLVIIETEQDKRESILSIKARK